MNYNHYFPFERNRYFAGKLLAAADFQAEQGYMDNKRRFLNHVLFGQGVVFGLGASALNDVSILVEEGVALDAEGREIILDAPAVKKLSSLEGFDKLSGEKAQLRIRYNEEKVHPVYAAGEGGNGAEYEFNRIREGCVLFVTDAGEENPEEDGGYMSRAVLLEQEDYRVTLSMPAAVCRGRHVRLLVTARKLSDRKVPLSFEGKLQLPSFTSEDGGRELSIGMRDVTLEKGQISRREYWLLADEGGQESSSLIWKEDAGQAFAGEYDVPFCPGACMKVELKEEEPEGLVLEQTGRNEPLSGDGREGVLLAELTLLRAQGAYVIAGVREARRYIPIPSMAREREAYLSCFAYPARRDWHGEPIERLRDAPRDEIHYEAPLMASGTLEIPLDVNMKKGEVCYSEEIMHGLGKGDVYVQAGVICLEEEDRMGSKAKSTVYGDSSLFQEQETAWVRTAVKVNNEKGSFRVAARLEGEQSSIVLLISWVALRFAPAVEGLAAEDYASMSISARVPTVRMEAGASRLIEVLFHGMEPCRLVYELTERGSGEITQDGVYTAPNTEGVYEIHIYCADIPQITTYAYAIVAKKQGIL